MHDQPTSKLPDPRIVEQVLAALDAGVPAEAAALAGAVHSTEAEVSAVLAAIRTYRHSVGVERARRSAPPADADTLPPGARLGDFVVDGVLGRGAMGVVYRARQLSLGGRLVALKVLPRALGAQDARFVERFHREAKLAAQIHHRHLAAVYGFDASTTDLCFAMRLVEGPTLYAVLERLGEACREPVRATSPQYVRRCVQLARSLADALSAIHAHRLVHRDVKPSNIVLEGAATTDARALDAEPVLVDFGLLRATGHSDLTGTRTLMGTPAYASHESQLGLELDERTDVFSLAATLYDLLTATAPGTRAPATAGLADVRTINPAVDARLAAILSMAMQPRRELRYEHGGALRDELDRWLRGDSVRALPVGALGRLRLWARREPARALRLGAALLVPFAVVIVIGVWFVGSVWSLASAADRAVRAEAAGDLLGAAAAYRELFHAGSQARMLPGLADDCARAAAYCAPESKLQFAVERLGAAHATLANRAATHASGEQEFAGAHQLLCELLLDDPPAHVSAAIQGFLLREARDASPEFRQRVAMDSWANYLLAQRTPQRVPAGLPEMLWAKLAPGAREQLASDTRQAAAAAYGAIRTLAAFENLVALMRDADAKVARIAAVCSWHVYRWLHKDQPEAHRRIGPAMLEAWGEAASNHEAELLDATAVHLAWWEHPPGAAPGARRRLNVSPVVRKAVDAKAAALWQEWERASHRIQDTSDDFQTVAGLRANDYEASIWKSTPAQDVEVFLTTPLAQPADRDAATGAVRFLRDATGRARTTIAGTVFAAASRSATVRHWETDDRAGYLCFARPGHSLLRVRSAVPDGAIGLEVRIVQMLGLRGPLRNGGQAMLRYSLTGLDWEHRERAPGGNHAGNFGPQDRDWAVRTVLQVPWRAFRAVRELEFVIEYLHGNTSHRILDVELAWTTSPTGR